MLGFAEEAVGGMAKGWWGGASRTFELGVLGSR